MPEDMDMILPEGFNPDLGDQNFDEDGHLTTPAVTEPTTAEVPAENNYSAATDVVAPSADPTIGQEIAQEIPTSVPQTVKVRFNHEDRELSMDEAAVYAQKGMNYDRVESRSREQEAKLSRYEEMAKLFGFESTDAMMEQAEQNYVEVKIKDLIGQGNSEAIARFLVNQEMEKSKAQRAAESPIKQSKPSALPEEEKAQLREFNQAFPDVTKIPDEVFRMHSEGVRLKTAYEIYQSRAALEEANKKAQIAQNELSILRQNQAAAARGPVTGTIGKTTPETPEADDPFLRGFNLDY